MYQRSIISSGSSVALVFGVWGHGLADISTSAPATDPEQVVGSAAYTGFFTMEGLPFMLGRDFAPEEGQAGRDHVVILSNRLWRRDFAANPDIVGKDIRLNGEPYTVVGVLPPGIHDRLNSQLWAPLVIEPDPTNQTDARCFGDGPFERRRLDCSGAIRDERHFTTAAKRAP